MPGVIIKLNKQRSDGKPRYRARWSNRYERGAKYVYKVHTDAKYLQTWLTKMDEQAAEAWKNPKPPEPPKPALAQTMTFAELVRSYPGA